MSKKITDDDVLNILNEFMDDSGSEKDDDKSDGDDSVFDDDNDDVDSEPSLTELQPMDFNLVEIIQNNYNVLREDEDVLALSLYENINSSERENDIQSDDEVLNSSTWGFDDSDEETEIDITEPSRNTTPVSHNVQAQKGKVNKQVDFIQLPWYKKNTLPKPHKFTSTSSMSNNINCQSTEFDIFNIFFPIQMIKLIKKETNRYAFMCIRSLRRKNALKSNCIWQKWKPVTVSDIYAFFSIILHMCIIPKPHLKDFWSKNPFIHSSFASKIMSRDRFLSIFSMLHLNNNSNYVSRGNNNYDPLFKIRPYVDFINKKMSETYQPGKNLTIDEGVCPFRGRVHFKVYMKNKPNKYGMKLYILSDPLNGYTLKFEIYSGKNDTDNSITALFDRLLSEYYYKGHTVYMDRFYTSPTVLKSLWEKNTNAVGTVMSNRRGLPKEIVKEKLKKGEMTFARQGPLICIKWKDTRDVLMLSTVHNADMTPVTVRSKIGPIEKFKPLAIVDYNLNKTGVDHGDQMVSYYPFQRKTLKWWKKMFFHLFMITVVNSFVLKKKNSSKNYFTKFYYKFGSTIVGKSRKAYK
jgi:hypothetical protein